MSRNFPNFISACGDAVKDSNIPEIFRTWSAISAVAGALGRRCWYDFGPFQVRPNLYIVLIAGPGRGKSLSLILPFDEIFSKLTAEPGTEPDDSWDPGENSGRLETYRMEDRPLYCVRDRITPEKLSRVMMRCGRQDMKLSTMDEPFHESSLTLVTSEFGTLVNRADHYLQMFLTGLWDAPNSYTYRTKNSGEDVLKGPCLNWIAGSTPEQFVTNLPENARTQGLLSRIIPVYWDGERAPQSIWYGQASYDHVEALREDLADISKMHGKFRFDDSIRERVAEEVLGGLKPTPTDPNLSEYLERRPAHFLKTMMSMSAARSSDLIVTEEDWEKTKELLFETEKFMPEALSHFGVGKAGKLTLDMTEFVSYITKSEGRKGISLMKFRQEILRKVSTPAEVEQTVRAMQDSGLIKLEGNMVIPNG